MCLRSDSTVKPHWSGALTQNRVLWTVPPVKTPEFIPGDLEGRTLDCIFMLDSFGETNLGLQGVSNVDSVADCREGILRLCHGS
jgi:hypothetical protein